MEPHGGMESAGGGGGGDAGTGLEEALQKLGIGGDAEAEAAAKLPERPGEADCTYYLRTGTCAYGERCRYNHPRDRRAAAAANGVGRTTSTVEYPERPGQPLCEYYVKNGTCKFGSNCKYNHPREGGFIPVVLNRGGYPLRPGENECSYYIKTGHCKFGATCKFHHPELGVIETSNMYQPMQPSTVSTHPYPQFTNLQMGRPPFVPGSFVPGSYPPMMLQSTVMPMQGWNPYISPMNQVPPTGGQQTVQAGHPYGLSHQAPTSSVSYGNHYAPFYPSAGLSSSNKQGHGFPERPGQPECEHYMKTGTCKFGPTCKYHHPQYFNAPNPNYMLNLLGLPLRPGSQPCAYYAQHGFCKFGPMCKFDHPMGSYSPSGSALTDVPVAPYPLSFPVASMARSPSDLRPQYPLTKESPANQPAFSGPTYGHAGSVAKIYAPHTLIRAPASTAAGLQAS